MKQRPILFSTPMVQAILAGTKTQTRRIVRSKVVPVVEECFRVNGKWCNYTFDYDLVELSPYGKPGDCLWVRETWAPNFRAPLGASERTPYVLYKANGDGSADQKWRPSIFMPRSASRIALKITAVRVERLQAITEADAKAEGCDVADLHRCYPSRHAAMIQTYCRGYEKLWERINGPGSWAKNPWVWVIEFRRIAP